MAFRSEDEIARWRQQNQRERGAVLSLGRVWELSKRWYGDRMRSDFRGRSIEDARQIFADLGLTDGFWMDG